MWLSYVKALCKRRCACVCGVCYSDYSSPVMYTTAVAAPSQPDPPMLSEQFVTALTVSWIRRPGDDLFTLHMDDESKVRAGSYLLHTLAYPGVAASGCDPKSHINQVRNVNVQWAGS